MSDTLVKTALANLGANELSLAEKKVLDEQGYLILPNIVDKAWLEALRNEFEQWHDNLKHSHNATRAEGGTRHVSNLGNKGATFERVYTQPKILAAVNHILGSEFRLIDLHGRDPLPGFGQQGLHSDAPPQKSWIPYKSVNSIWMLDDFTIENGATRIVPGTHLLKSQPNKSLANSNHPKEISAVGKAGSVLVFNAHIWHSGMRNQSQKTRRALQCLYGTLDYNYISNLDDVTE